MSPPNLVEELRCASEIADARLEVAEEFAWLVGVLSAALVFVTLHQWGWTVLAFIAGFALSVFPLRKESDKAEDAYFKAAHLGNYMQPRNEPPLE